MSNYRQLLENKKGRRDQVLHDLEQTEIKEKTTRRQAMYAEEAQLIIQTVAKLTQDELVYHISELVTLAFDSVFPDPYEFDVEFVQRRGRTECDLWFVRDGHRIHPLMASAGGEVDVASFALQIALWSLSKPRTRNILILDEPLKFLKGENFPELGALMIQEISKKLGLQIIMVSHISDQFEGADKRIKVSLVNKRSQVKGC